MMETAFGVAIGICIFIVTAAIFNAVVDRVAPKIDKAVERFLDRLKKIKVENDARDEFDSMSERCQLLADQIQDSSMQKKVKDGLATITETAMLYQAETKIVGIINSENQQQAKQGA